MMEVLLCIEIRIRRTEGTVKAQRVANFQLHQTLDNSYTEMLTLRVYTRYIPT